MYTFILIINSSDKLKNLSDLSIIGEIKEESQERFSVEENNRKNGWISIYYNEDVLFDYDDSEKLKIINETIESPVFIVVEGRDSTTDFANQFILNFDSRIKALIDNDHGIITEIKIIKELIAKNIKWLYLNEL